jgi:hypothetical protein
MNIGILTYHFVSNFGANLQTLSTFMYLKKHHYNPIIIDWVPYDLEKYYNYKDLLERNLLELKDNHLSIPTNLWYISNSVIVELLEGEKKWKNNLIKN